MNIKELNIIQKIALIWVTPAIVLISLCVAAGAIAFFVITSMLVHSGTIGAALFLFKEIKAKLVKFQFKKIKKQDEQQAAFDRMMHKESK